MTVKEYLNQELASARESVEYHAERVASLIDLIAQLDGKPALPVAVPSTRDWIIKVLRDANGFLSLVDIMGRLRKIGFNEVEDSVLDRLREMEKDGTVERTMLQSFLFTKYPGWKLADPS